MTTVVSERKNFVSATRAGDLNAAVYRQHSLVRTASGSKKQRAAQCDAKVCAKRCALSGIAAGAEPIKHCSRCNTASFAFWCGSAVIADIDSRSRKG